MITPDMIRKIQTVIDAFEKAWVDDEGDEAEVIAAVLNAWPRSNQLAENDSASIRGFACIILPLPQESGDLGADLHENRTSNGA